MKSGDGTKLQNRRDSESWKTKDEMGRLSGIRFWDYKRETFENKSKQEVIMEEYSKESTGPPRAILPDMIIIILKWSRVTYRGPGLESSWPMP
ncbi:hypothetical protein TNCV_3322771 [Trichonephila clavipes]|nr:hypothetical protein TNCV_3322771 [Trichonephila clavipes]